MTATLRMKDMLPAEFSVFIRRGDESFPLTHHDHVRGRETQATVALVRTVVASAGERHYDTSDAAQSRNVEVDLLLDGEFLDQVTGALHLFEKRREKGKAACWVSVENPDVFLRTVPR